MALRHGGIGRLRQQLAQDRTAGIGEAHVGDATIPEKCLRSLMAAINELVGHHHVARAQMLLQRADG